MSATPPADWETIKATFLQALELPPAAREAFLTTECGANAGLRAEVQSLLAAHDDERPFLDVPPIMGAAHVLAAALDRHELRATRLQPGMRIAQYDVLDSIGSGGMGDVYRARDTRLDRFVALKTVVDQTGGTGDRVLREARAASALNHPNICTLYEAGEADGEPFLAMEYIAGQPLSALIPPDGFDGSAVVHYGAQIGDALAHAHEHGVIHRDLKTANIVVTPEGRAKVLDFGIARRSEVVAEGAGSGTLTAGSTTSGTLAYMAPELLREGRADARSDIWALGVLLYELASGRHPFVADTASELASAISNGTPPLLPPKVPADLRGVIFKCLDRNPDARFQRASDVVDQLTAFAATTGAVPRANRAGAWLGLAAAVLLVAAYAAYESRGSAPRTGGSPGTSAAPVPLDVPSAALKMRQTDNPAARQLYLRGREELATNARPNTEAAFASFQEAVALDDAYALAHAGVAMASARMRHFFAREDEVRTWEERAHTSALRAIALAPDLAESHEALAAVFRSTEFKWAETVDESVAALTRNPGLDQPHLFLASAFEHLGLLDRAGAEARTAMDINQANIDEPLRVRGGRGHARRAVRRGCVAPRTRRGRKCDACRMESRLRLVQRRAEG